MKNQLMCGDIVIPKTNKTVPFDYVIQICLFIFASILLLILVLVTILVVKKKKKTRPTLPSKERWRTTKLFFFPHHNCLLTLLWNPIPSTDEDLRPEYLPLGLNFHEFYAHKTPISLLSHFQSHVLGVIQAGTSRNQVRRSLLNAKRATSFSLSCKNYLTFLQILTFQRLFQEVLNQY